MTALSLPTLWVAPVRGLVFLAPIVTGDEVVVRSSHAVSFHALADGHERARVALPAADLYPSFLVRSGRLVFTECCVERRRWVVAVAPAGIAWTAPLGGVVIEGAAAIVGDELWVVVDTRKKGRIVIARFDAATGGARKAITLRVGGDRLLVDGDARIVLSRVGDAETPSAYVLGDDGAPRRVLRRDALACGSSWNGLLVTSTRGARDGSSTVEVCDVHEARVLWSHPAASEVTCIDRGEVAVFEADGPECSSVLRDARTGEPRGRIGVGAIEPARATFVGSLLIVRHMGGAVLVDRDAHRVIGEADVWTATAAGELGLIGGDGSVHAVPLRA